MKMANVVRFLRAYKRVIVSSLVFAYAAFLLIHPDEFGRFLDMAFLAIFVMLIASQFFWVRRVLDVVERFLPGKSRRSWLAVVAFLIYLFFFIYSYPSIESTNDHVFRAADPRLSSLLIVGIFWWWLVASWAGFVLWIAFSIVGRAGYAVTWAYRKAHRAGQPDIPTVDSEAVPPSPGRRRFLEQAAVLVSATPFVATGYGLLYGRLDVEVVRQRIRLARLPKAFEGFRIAQLSDLHISPFTTAEHIRHCVTITNALKSDLIALTGDFISWDPEAEGDAVSALAGLRAPFGVFGCLGNHEQESSTEESITRLFAVKGIHILRQERAPIRLGGETLNLIGVDDPPTELPEPKVFKPLVMPDTVNILLTHEPDPNVLDRAVELGIDLTLTGHTHGGQLALEFLHRGLSLARLETPYVSGWFEKGGAQLYVNRGIGTTGFPVRFGARPEITVLELVRGA
jgi:predicted MPP superfamily phosphohydrolase